MPIFFSPSPLNTLVAAVAGGVALASTVVMATTPALAAPGHFHLVANVPVGHGPNAVAVDSAAHIVYVANFSDGSVSVLEGGSGRSLRAPIPLGQPPLGIAVDSTTHKVYAVDGDTANGSRLSIIDGADLAKPVLDVPLTCCPNGVAVNPTDHLVYVTNTSDAKGTTVSILDGSTGQPVHAPIQMPSFSQPGSVAVDSSTNTIYVGDLDLAEMWEIDGKTDTLDPSPIEGIGAAPQLSIDSSTHMVYVASGPLNALTVVAESTNRQVASINLGAGAGGRGVGASGVAVDPSTHDAYVGDSLSKTTSIVDGGDLAAAPISVSVDLRVNFQPDVTAIAVDPATHIAYQTDMLDNTLSIIAPSDATRPPAG
jgi:DNA-binding beta-propeller fold protein YncE